MFNALDPALAILKPPLKWAGGKRWLVPHLAPLWKPFSERRLVEPFCGGLAVTLGLMPGRALLNDRNPHLMNFYSWLKRGMTIAIPMEYDETLYYAHRARFNQLLREHGTADEMHPNFSENSAGESGNPKIERSQSRQTPHPALSPSDPAFAKATARHGGQRVADLSAVAPADAEAAALFYYLNRTGYNGLCRFNQSGEFNVPFGQFTRVNYRREFSAYQEVFATWQFTSCDFAGVATEDDDFIYADPPYDVEFTQYSKEVFGWDEQVRAAEWLSRHKGPVVLSNQATERILSLYRKLGFDLRFLDAPRRISRTGDRTPAKEVLATRNLGVWKHRTTNIER